MMSPASREPLRFSSPKVLLVEGKTDEFFFRALLGTRGWQDIQVQEFEGSANLPVFLRTLEATPGFSDVQRLAVVRDADDDASRTFQSIQTALGLANLAAPSYVGEFVGSSPAVGVFVVTDGSSRGMLEDLCLAAVAADPAMNCVSEFFKCLRSSNLPDPRPMSKALIQAFLASREKPGLRLGEAASKGYFPWGSPAFDEIRRFLASLEAAAP